MVILSMETQTHINMAHGVQEERATEPTEEMGETEKQFLKDLYSFMKKRDTPIERIPNLGFKQIDLFVMFKTVRDMGGYHQVTAQQLWKQVYNMLGGNPRSTSAATCTRRHYEKLLLPYECHVKGVAMNTLPPHQPKNLHYTAKNDMSLRPAKRKLISIPLHQQPHGHQAGRHGNLFPVSLCYPRYYHPSHAVLPPHVPISSPLLAPRSPPEPQPRFSFNAYQLNPTERATEPLEHLRSLAELYKNSSGLAEPLNLSVKASKEETKSRPASSFAPPPSSKNPKFLNKPSPLYTAHFPQVARSEMCETQDDEAGSGEAYPAKAREAYVVDVKAITGSSSPTYDSDLAIISDDGATATAQSPSSPRRDSAMQPKGDREGSPEVRGLDLSHILPNLPQDNRGEMEIEIPLSVFNNWLRLCRSSATTSHGDKQLHTLPTPEEPSGKRICSDADFIPANVTFRMNPQHQSSVAEDLRLRQRSPTPVVQTSDYRNNNVSQDPFTSYRPVPSGGILRNAASRDVYPFDQRDINKSYSSKPSNCWDPYDQQTWVRQIQTKSDSNPLTAQQNFAASESYNEDRVQGGKPETLPSTLLMMDPSSTSLLRLTPEELMKLKKIISSSL